MPARELVTGDVVARASDPRCAAGRRRGSSWPPTRGHTSDAPRSSSKALHPKSHVEEVTSRIAPNRSAVDRLVLRSYFCGHSPIDPLEGQRHSDGPVRKQVACEIAQLRPHLVPVTRGRVPEDPDRLARVLTRLQVVRSARSHAIDRALNAAYVEGEVIGHCDTLRAQAQVIDTLPGSDQGFARIRPNSETLTRVDALDRATRASAMFGCSALWQNTSDFDGAATAGLGPTGVTVDPLLETFHHSAVFGLETGSPVPRGQDPSHAPTTDAGAIGVGERASPDIGEVKSP